MKLKKISVILAAIMLIGALCFAFGACDRNNEKSKTTLIAGTTASIEKATRDEYDFDVLSGTLSQLAPVSLNGDGTYSPLLTDFASEDSAVWIYTVRKGMKWHDGKDVTAEDILFTLRYLDEHEGKNYFVKVGDSDAKYTSAEVSEDKRSLTLTLAVPNVRELSNMTTIRIMPEHIFRGKKISEVTAEQSRIGCGPYMFSSFNKSAGTVIFSAFAGYPDGAPVFEKVIFQTFNNADTMALSLAGGDIDIIWNYSGGLSQAAAAYFSKTDNLRVQALNALNNPAVLMFNNSKAPFDNANIRKAVVYAINYAQFKKLFATEYGASPREGFVPEGTEGYIQTAQLSQDLIKSAEFLSAEGYSDADKDSAGYHTRNGARLSFKLSVNGTNELHLRYAELLQNNLKEAGVEVILDICGKEIFQSKTSNKFSNNNVTHQAAVIGFTAAGMAMSSGLGTIYIDGAHSVQGGAQVSDPAFKEILSALSDARTTNEYATAAARCQQYYAQNMPVVSLYQDSSLQAYSNRFSGFWTDGNFGLLNVKSWYTVKIA